MESFIGSITLFAGNFAPRGWAFCDGSILSIAQNTALFSLLGTTYGGNGQTTFALPNLQGRVPIHPGQGAGLSNYQLGQVGGAENVTLTVNTMPAHTHVPQAQVTIHASARSDSETPGGAVMGGSSGGTQVYASAPDGSTNMNSGMATASIQIGSTGGSQPFSIVQPYQCVNYIICLEGIFPSRN